MISTANNLLAIAKVPADAHDSLEILFSAHSLPLSVVERGDTYPQEVAGTVDRVMQKLNYQHVYRLTWQSAVGPKWLGPQTVETVKKLGSKGRKAVVVVPIAFTSDHIETLSEIDIEIQEEAHKSGIKHFVRAGALNDSKTFTNAMAHVVASHLKANEKYSALYPIRCPGCTNDQCRNTSFLQ